MFFTPIAHAGQKSNTTFRNHDAGSFFQSLNPKLLKELTGL